MNGKNSHFFITYFYLNFLALFVFSALSRYGMVRSLVPYFFFFSKSNNATARHCNFKLKTWSRTMRNCGVHHFSHLLLLLLLLSTLPTYPRAHVLIVSNFSFIFVFAHHISLASGEKSLWCDKGIALCPFDVLKLNTGATKSNPI